jgi:hypothetical protein
MPQVVDFRFAHEQDQDLEIGVTPRDADRLVELLRRDASPDAKSAADKIENAMKLGEETAVKLGIGEDERVLRALEQLRDTGDYLSALARLERAISSKIEREG